MSIEKKSVHGVLLNVFDVGTLITGESGVGKSECALELMDRGHTLIADDVVDIELIDGRVFGAAPELLAGLIEIRGLGIVDSRQMFGPFAIGKRHSIDLCIEFRAWQTGDENDRINAEPEQFQLLGQNVPKFDLAIGPGRPIALLVETAVKLFVQKSSGIDAERDLITKHDKSLAA